MKNVTITRNILENIDKVKKLSDNFYEIPLPYKDANSDKRTLELYIDEFDCEVSIVNYDYIHDINSNVFIATIKYLHELKGLYELIMKIKL